MRIQFNVEFEAWTTEIGQPNTSYIDGHVLECRIASYFVNGSIDVFLLNVVESQSLAITTDWYLKIWYKYKYTGT